jgi:excisionase family DNA binding protein
MSANTRISATSPAAPATSPADHIASMLNGYGEQLTPSEVARLFRVDPKTVTRWAKAGRLTSTQTIGGHRRYFRTEVEQLLMRTLTIRS